MAHIRKIKDRYNAMIRKKNVQISATFSNLQDAELWAKYKEDLIDGIVNFDPPLKEMITLNDAIELKINNIKNGKNPSQKELNDYRVLNRCFEIFLPTKISDISYNDYFAHFNTLMNTPITKGGTQKNDGSGVTRLPSPLTIIKKFAYLSTVYQMLIYDGVQIENHPSKIATFFKKKYEKEVYQGNILNENDQSNIKNE